MDDDLIEYRNLLKERRRFLFVFVSGPLDRYRSAWAYRNGTGFWPEDLSLLLNRRISTYMWRPSTNYKSWNSESFGTTVIRCAESLLGDLKSHTTEERVVFVAHSLGGLIVKEALCQTSGLSGHTKLAQRTAGVVFFGTPHWLEALHGSDPIRNILDILLPGTTLWTDASDLFYRRVLSGHSKTNPTTVWVLEDASTRFVKVVEEHGYSICSFLEDTPQGWRRPNTVSL